MSIYNIHNFIDLVIEGKGPLYDYMSFQFKYFQTVRSSPNENNLSLNINGWSKSEYRQELKGDNESFLKLKNDNFAWKVTEFLCSLDGKKALKDQSEINLDSRFPKMRSNAIIDLILRIQLIEKNVFLVHASCVENEKGAVLMPAWKGVGKTAASLKMIEAGCNFLGDDKVWIDSNGMVYAYPRYAVIKDSNALQFPDFVNKKTKLKLFFRSKIGVRSFFRKNRYFNYIIDKILLVPVSYHYIEDLFPGTKISNQAPLDKIVTLSRHNQSVTDFKNCNYEQMVTKTRNISDVEWNYDLFHLATAHDVLFPDGPSWKEEINSLLSKERKIMNQAFYKIDCFEAQFPSDTKKIDWGKFINKTTAI